MCFVCTLSISRSELSALPAKLTVVIYLLLLIITYYLLLLALSTRTFILLFYNLRLFSSASLLMIFPQSMACLSEFDCMFNKLTALPAEFGASWSQIKRLSLGKNRLRVLPPEIGLLVKLVELVCRHTHHTCTRTHIHMHPIDRLCIAAA